MNEEVWALTEAAWFIYLSLIGHQCLKMSA